MKSISRALILLVAGAVLIPALAFSAEPEKVVVRNRLYTNEGKFEASANVGFTLVNYLTSHTNLTASLAYNVTEQWAVELAAGYALSRQTNVAEAASTEVVQSKPDSQHKQVDDFEDLWQMTWNATVVARWSPIYGKVNVAAELPLHFNAYLLAGGGVGGMERDSLVYCLGNVPDSQRPIYTCSADPADPSHNLTPLHDSQVKPLFVGGAGMRFHVVQWASFKVEVRDVAFLDSYRVNITRALAEKDQVGSAPTQGVEASNPGVTNLVLLNIGATFTF